MGSGEKEILGVVADESGVAGPKYLSEDKSFVDLSGVSETSQVFGPAHFEFKLRADYSAESGDFEQI